MSDDSLIDTPGIFSTGVAGDQQTTPAVVVSSPASTEIAPVFDGLISQMGRMKMEKPKVNLDINVPFATHSRVLPQWFEGSSGSNGMSCPTTVPLTPLFTNTTLQASATSVPYGMAITLTATVWPSGATGDVIFHDDKTDPKVRPLVSGKAILNISSLRPGMYAIMAAYEGSSEYLPSRSHTVNVMVTATYLSSASLLNDGPVDHTGAGVTADGRNVMLSKTYVLQEKDAATVLLNDGSVDNTGTGVTADGGNVTLSERYVLQERNTATVFLDDGYAEIAKRGATNTDGTAAVSATYVLRDKKELI